VLEPPSAVLADTLRHPPAIRALIASAEALQPHPHLLKLAVALRALLWCGTAAPLLSQPSNMGDIAAVVAAGRHVPIPEGAAVMRHAKSLLQRGREWKVNALALLELPGPVPLQPFYGALAASRHLPVDLTLLEGRLDAVIVDGGRPYCLCRGLTGGLMVGCDFCDEWFHPQVRDGVVGERDDPCITLHVSTLYSLSPETSALLFSPFLPQCVGLTEAAAAALLSPPEVTAKSAAEAQAEIEAAALAYLARRGRSGRLKRGVKSASSVAAAAKAATSAAAAAAVHESSVEFRCPACCARAGLPYAHTGAMALNLQVSGQDCNLPAATLSLQVSKHPGFEQKRCVLHGSLSPCLLFGPSPFRRACERGAYSSKSFLSRLSAHRWPRRSSRMCLLQHSILATARRRLLP
jgi:hypothetical protein